MPPVLPLLRLVSSSPCVSSVRSPADFNRPPLLSVFFTVKVSALVSLARVPPWFFSSPPVTMVVPVPLIKPSWLSISPVVKVIVPLLKTPPVLLLLAVISFSPCVSSVISPADSILPPVLLSFPLSSFRFFLLVMVPATLFSAC